ncbi:MAG TPA: HNH endonuclease, partial [Thermodesulfovibrionia bacterium]|nr:HNH endonuclease [Thermodesulfovibrionia bacterium]
MKKCIYCRELKEESEFSLEHVIPQFLGGAYSSLDFKIRDVCKVCNSNLGLFVDAGFEKNFLVSNYLKDNAYSFFDPSIPVGLPLMCMGPSDLIPPHTKDEEVCECWLGPLGEQVYWIRPKDERLYWYVGGNPRTTKTAKSNAYFLFSERSVKNPLLSWLTFRDAFEGRRVKKVMCTIVEGSNPGDIGFSDPDSIDIDRVEYFNSACLGGETRHIRLSMYTKFDIRFLAKISIGIAYSLFGPKVLSTTYADELYKALWYREGDAMPAVKGVSLF